MIKRHPQLSLSSLCVGLGGEGADAAAPARLLVLPKGRHEARQRGLVICSDATLAGFTAAQQSMKRHGRMALDFEHNTVPGTPAFLAEREPKLIAAWADAVPTSLGVEYQNIEWTPAGLDAWKNKSFQDLSPAVFRRPDGTVIALHSVALVRHGELDGLTIEAAASPPALAPLFAALSASIESNETTQIMKPSPALIALLAALNVTLSDTADEAATEAALLDGAKALDAMKAEKKPDAMSADFVTMQSEIKRLKDSDERRERAALLAAAAAEGKVIPLSAEALNTTPLAVLKDIVTHATPGQVPVKKTTPEGASAPGGVEAFHADELEAFAAFGLTPEAVRASASSK